MWPQTRQGDQTRAEALRHERLPGGPGDAFDDAREREGAVVLQQTPDPPGLERLGEVGRRLEVEDGLYARPAFAGTRGATGRFWGRRVAGTGSFSGSTLWMRFGLPTFT